MSIIVSNEFPEIQMILHENYFISFYPARDKIKYYVSTASNFNFGTSCSGKSFTSQMAIEGVILGLSGVQILTNGDCPEKDHRGLPEDAQARR